MSEILYGVRNRLQDKAIDWQDRRFRNADFRQQQADIHRSRITCSASLPAFQQTQSWTEYMSQSRGIPVIEEVKAKPRMISGDGIRWDAAIAVIVLVAVLLTAVLASDLAGIGMSSRSIVKLSASIDTQETRNERVRTEIEMNSDSASVCTEAVKLNLISSNGATTVRMTVPGNAQLMVSSASEAAENADLEGRLTSSAGD